MKAKSVSSGPSWHERRLLFSSNEVIESLPLPPKACWVPARLLVVVVGFNEAQVLLQCELEFLGHFISQNHMVLKLK